MKKVFNCSAVLFIGVLFCSTTYGQGSISGPTSVCMQNGPVQSQYTLSGSSATSGYTWTAPSSSVIISGQGSKTITIMFTSPASGGVIQVTGNGLSATLSPIKVDVVPNAPNPISGPSTVCPGGTATFTVPASSPTMITQVAWAAPNATIISQDRTSLVVSFPTSYTGGQISVQGIGGVCGAGPALAKSITASSTTAAPGVISGPSSISSGQTGVAYSVPSIAGATGYQWSLPTGATLAAGLNTNSITVNFSTSFSAGNITVQGINSSCNGPVSAPIAVTVLPPPGPAGQISGNEPCMNGSDVIVTYSVPPIANASFYIWSWNATASPVGSVTSNPIQLKFPAGTSDTSIRLTVMGNNSSGNGVPSSTTFSIFRAPAAAGPISQSTTTVCAGQTNVTYSVAPIANSSQYVWTLPAGVTVIGPTTNNSITVNFASSFTSGNFSVYGLGAGSCSPSSPGAPSTLPVTVTSLPASPGVISGPSAVTPGQTAVAYSVPAISNATGYQWSLPSGATLTTGSNTNSITVNFSTSFSGGNITVQGTNGSCNGPISASPFMVTLIPPPGPAGQIIGNAPCMNGSDVLVTYSVSPIINATSYVWQWNSTAVPVGSTTGSSIQLKFPAGISETSITLTVKGLNSTGFGTPSSGTYSIFRGPGAAGAISQSTPNICPGQNNITYSIAPIPNSMQYVWSLPAGVTAVGDPTSNSITVNFATSFTSGTLSVYGLGQGSCTSSSPAPGSTSSLPVSAPPLPATPGAIIGSSSIVPGQSGVAYSVPVIGNASSYQWNLPSGVTLATGSNTNSITVNFSTSYISGIITVQGINSCYGPVSTPLTVNALPSAAGAISGGSACMNGSDVFITYSVSPIANATSYHWSWDTSTGVVAVGSVVGSSVQFKFPSSVSVTSLALYVNGVNSYGSGAASPTLTIPLPFASPIKNLPASASAITGKAMVCPGETGVIYSVPAIANATGYVWNIPSGAAITSGQNSASITVNYASTVSGNVSVYGSNCMGNGTASTVAVTLKLLPSAPSDIVGKAQVCMGEGSVTYSVPPVANATGYVWSVPSWASQGSGQNTNSIVVNYSGGSTPGAISVAGTNSCGSGPSSSLPIIFTGAAAGPNMNYAVDQLTGTLNASLPLFSVQSGDIQISGLLSYSGSGVRVTDDDGWLGLNWGLSVQSYGIFREMRNLPDDYTSGSDNRKGWLFNNARATISSSDLNPTNNPAICSDEASQYATLSGLTYDQDTEPDVFHVSIPGLSFDFYFDEAQVPKIHTVPLQDVVITPFTAFPGTPFGSSSTAAPITAFTVKDSKGIIYEFTEVETLTENVYQKSQYYFVRRTNQHYQPFSYTTGWRLTSVLSPVYGEINLTYNLVAPNDNNIVSNPYPRVGYFADAAHAWDLEYVYHYPLVTSNTYGAGANLGYSRTPKFKVLATISSSTNEVHFSSTSKSADNPMQRLDQIAVFDKREGQTKSVRTIDFAYNLGDRVFLSEVRIWASCSFSSYNFVYNSTPSLPVYSSADKDEWEFYKVKDGSYLYDETAVAGSLQRIIQPQRGYAVFFYQVNDYWDGSSSVQGGGIRVRKIITYDGVSSKNDQVQEFEYKTEDGSRTSGKLQHRAALSFSVARQSSLIGFAVPGVRYRTASGLSNVNDLFTIRGNQDMSKPSLLNGSVVAYERVSVKTKDYGKTVYEYDLPASAGDVTANNGEWEASKVLIARPNTSTCFETPNMSEGYYRYPFPVNPNYEFGRGQLKKVTNFNESGIKVRDVVYAYQRIYGVGNGGIRKIYGLALEELPTYYYNGSYVDGTMYLYSKYQIFTDVKTELSSQTETVYNSTDLTKNTQTASNYFYESQAHRELTRVETQNSDGSLSRNVLTYSKDYPVTTPSGSPAVALSYLNSANRNVVIESVSKKVVQGSEKFMGASLSLYQIVGGKPVPDKQYTAVSNDGTMAFSPSTLNANAFQYDQTNYVLAKNYLSFDSFNNATSVGDRSRNINSGAYGYSGTLPVINISQAGLNEISYSDFETSTPVDFTISGFTPTYDVGRTSSTSKALNLPVGSSGVNMLVSPALVNNKSQNYVFSFWVKSASPGSLSLKVTNSVTGASTTFPCAYGATVGNKYQYFRFKIPVATLLGMSTSFSTSLWSSNAILIDDIAFYPSNADIVTSTYAIPNGKTSETDSRGLSLFYENDLWGRPLLVYDRDGNIIKKYTYKNRP